jgi:1-acyl-sn-glycerol-3-phosphate acyltransferase
MQKTAIRIFQLFILLVVRLYYLGRVKVYMQSELDISGPVVISANHTHRHDPFIIACFIPLKTIFRIFPYGFMTANVYYYKMWRPIANIAGCFPAKQRNLSSREEEFGVGAAKKMLSQGYSILMFPEGKRTTEPINAKPGISRILQHHDSHLLLCHISWHRGPLGKVVTLNLKVADKVIDTKNPDDIMKAVYSLEREKELLRPVL